MAIVRSASRPSAPARTVITEPCEESRKISIRGKRNVVCATIDSVDDQVSALVQLVYQPFARLPTLCPSLCRPDVLGQKSHNPDLVLKTYAAPSE